MSKNTSNFSQRNRLKQTIGCLMSSQRHSCLVTDHFLFKRGWGGGELANTKAKCCTTSAEEIKIVHSGTKQRNTSQASGITLIQQEFVFEGKKLRKQIPAEKNCPPHLLFQMHNSPSLTGTGISYAMKIVHDFIFVREINIVRTANSFSGLMFLDSLGSLDIRFSCVLVWSQKRSKCIRNEIK